LSIGLFSLAAAGRPELFLDASLQAAQTAHVPVRELHGPRATLDAARPSLQEARRPLNRGNHEEASAALPAVRRKLDLAVVAMTSIPPRATPARGCRR
jgi:hypothetical protein